MLQKLRCSLTTGHFLFQYPSEYNLMADFDLMFKNARHYNEEGSLVYNDAVTLEKALKAKWRAVCHQADPKKTPKR